jgi:hypothetical protein
MDGVQLATLNGLHSHNPSQATFNKNSNTAIDTIAASYDLVHHHWSCEKITYWNKSDMDLSDHFCISTSFTAPRDWNLPAITTKSKPSSSSRAGKRFQRFKRYTKDKTSLQQKTQTYHPEMGTKRRHRLRLRNLGEPTPDTVGQVPETQPFAQTATTHLQILSSLLKIEKEQLWTLWHEQGKPERSTTRNEISKLQKKIDKMVPQRQR